MTLRFNNRFWKAMTLTAALTLSVLSIGCTQDQHVFTSDTFSPKTVSVIDTTDRSELWRYEIPVGYKMELTFLRNQESTSTLAKYNSANPTEAEYKLISIDPALTGYEAKEVVEEGYAELNGNHVTMLLEIREAPEAPRPLPGVESDALPTPEADQPTEPVAAG